ncbi:hypothetical protein [Microbacterium rhizophilus]|uniref:hypothetical protein n=1 Tax=Microbacterium rhizophilus TaxID=3138934 RepID=UPI0031EFCAD1
MRIEGYDTADDACRLLAAARASAEQGAAALAVARELTAWHSPAGDAFRETTVQHGALASALVAACDEAARAIRWQSMVHAGGVAQEA